MLLKTPLTELHLSWNRKGHSSPPSPLPTPLSRRSAHFSPLPSPLLSMSGKPRSSAPRSSNGPRAGGAAAPAAAAAAGAASSSAAATPSKKSGADNAAERQASPDAAAAAATGAPVPAGDETRLLVDWHHVGAIIGKGGQSGQNSRHTQHPRSSVKYCQGARTVLTAAGKHARNQHERK